MPAEAMAGAAVPAAAAPLPPVSSQPAVQLPQLAPGRRLPQAQALLATPGLELTYNGRSALLRACRELAASGARRVLVPAYHCPACVTPVLQAGLEPAYYRIDRTLHVDADDLLARCRAGGVAAVMAIQYFGIPQHEAAFDAVRALGLPVLEDWSHSFFDAEAGALAGRDDSYRVYSFWKTVPSIAGGGLLRPGGQPAPVGAAPLQPPPRGHEVRLYKRFVEEAIAQSDRPLLKAMATALENTRLRLKGVRPGAPAAPVAPAAPSSADAGGDEGVMGLDLVRAGWCMPAVSRRLLLATDLTQMAERRRARYSALAAHWGGTPGPRPVLPALPPEATPWLFPLFVDDRERFSRECRTQAGLMPQTFGTVLHPSLAACGDARLIDDARHLAEHVVCVPVHQDLDPEQLLQRMRRLSLRLQPAPAFAP